MTRLQSFLNRACGELGLDIVIPFVLDLPSGRRVFGEALLPQLGAPKGMIVVTAYDALSGVVEELVHNGYGFSVLEDPPDHERFELEDYREMFLEWNGGDPKVRPD